MQYVAEEEEEKKPRHYPVKLYLLSELTQKTSSTILLCPAKRTMDVCLVIALSKSVKTQADITLWAQMEKVSE